MDTTTETGPTRSLRAVRRRAVDVDPAALVRSRPFADGPHGSLPVVIEPVVPGVDLSAWATANHDEIFATLYRHGAVLFRGFGLTSPSEFEDAAAAVCPDLFSEYGDLPKEPTARRIYQSTPYPNDKAILFHNESSHLPQWPMKQFFFCVTASETGGETPVLDCRRAVQEMDPELLATFEAKGLRCTRTFAEGLDVSWQDFFKTDSKDDIERLCTAAGMTCEWTDRGYLRISNQATAVLVHPVTGERVFFNQVQLHHVSCLDAATRESLLALFDRADLPRNVYYGDGRDIPDEVMASVGRLFDELMVPVPWQPGDILMLDNMLVSHGRLPFTGKRKVCVAMAEMAGHLDRAGAELLA